MTNDESNLIVRFNKGDEQAFNEVFKLYHRPLHYYIGRFSLATDEVEDILSEVFFRLFKTARDGKQFESLEHVKNFLFVVARNEAITHLHRLERQEKHMRTLPEPAPEEVEAGNQRIEAEMLHMIYNAVENLPTECKRIFKMYYLDEQGYKEIAGELGLSPQTVRNQKARAIMLLRKYILNPGSLVLIGVISLL